MKYQDNRLRWMKRSPLVPSLSGTAGMLALGWLCGCWTGPNPLTLSSPSAEPARPWHSVLYGPDWSPWPKADFTHDKILQDFSYAGYARSERPIPEWPDARVWNVVREFGADPTGTRDSTAAIQAAIDAAASSGEPAIVYLPEGLYLVQPPADRPSALTIRTSRTVLRGAGPEKTRILNTSTEMRGKQIVRAAAGGTASWSSPEAPETPITEDLMGPTVQVPVKDTRGFQVDDVVLLCADTTREWVEEHDPNWVGEESRIGRLMYLRRLTGIQQNPPMLTIDIPIRYALKTRDHARVYRKTGLLHDVGFENFSIGNVEHPGTNGWAALDFAAPTGDYAQRLMERYGVTAEELAVRKNAYDVHGSNAVRMNQVMDGWIRNVRSFHPDTNRTATHLLSNGIALSECRGVTVIGCDMRFPQYGGGGGNGYMFRLGNCNECLIQDCTASHSRHGYSILQMASSGNVLLRCRDAYAGHQEGGGGDNTPIAKGSDLHMWFSHSNLYDGCIAEDSWFEARDRYHASSRPGHNLTSAHSVYWNTEGVSNSFHNFVVWSQQAHYGYVIGTRGAVTAVRTDGEYPERFSVSDPPDFVEGVGRGDTLFPASLFEDQLRRRLGKPR